LVLVDLALHAPSRGCESRRAHVHEIVACPNVEANAEFSGAVGGCLLRVSVGAARHHDRRDDGTRGVVDNTPANYVSGAVLSLKHPRAQSKKDHSMRERASAEAWESRKPIFCGGHSSIHTGG